MIFLTLTTLVIELAGLAAFSAEPVALNDLKADSAGFFVGEEARVTFTVDLSKMSASDRPRYLSLFRVDAQGRKDKFLALLADRGMTGDSKAGDGIFSRKLFLKESRARDLYVAASWEDEGKVSVGTIISPHPLRIAVQARPTLQEIVGTIASRLWHRYIKHDI